jgi:hypothetical protein
MTQASECVRGLQNEGRFPYSLLVHAYVVFKMDLLVLCISVDEGTVDG